MPSAPLALPINRSGDQIFSFKNYHFCGNTRSTGSGNLFPMSKKKTGTGILFVAHPTYQLREEKKEGRREWRQVKAPIKTGRRQKVKVLYQSTGSGDLFANDVSNR
jgi:hypothetical protein